MQCNTGTSRNSRVSWQCIVYHRNLKSETYMMACLEFQNVLWTLKPTLLVFIIIHSHECVLSCNWLVYFSRFSPSAKYSETTQSEAIISWYHPAQVHTQCSPGRPRRAGSCESLCGNTDPPSSWRGPPRFFTLFTSSALNGVKYVLIPQGLLKTLRGMETFR